MKKLLSSLTIVSMMSLCLTLPVSANEIIPEQNNQISSSSAQIAMLENNIYNTSNISYTTIDYLEEQNILVDGETEISFSFATDSSDNYVDSYTISAKNTDTDGKTNFDVLLEVPEEPLSTSAILNGFYSESITFPNSGSSSEISIHAYGYYYEYEIDYMPYYRPQQVSFSYSSTSSKTANYIDVQFIMYGSAYSMDGNPLNTMYSYKNQLKKYSPVAGRNYINDVSMPSNTMMTHLGDPMAGGFLTCQYKFVGSSASEVYSQLII